MSISISSAVGSAYQNYQTDSSKDQFKKDMQSIQAALQSGDISGAQDAFSKLQELQQQKVSKNGSSPDQVQKDMKTLQSALDSGNLQDAQSAFTQLQTDMKAHGGGHHKHHQSQDASVQSTATVDTRTGASPTRYA
jgi:hypothetical protein